VVALPPDDQAAALLHRVGVRPDAVVAAVAARPRPGSAAWSRLDDRHQELVTGTGLVSWDDPPPDADPVERWLTLWAFVAAIPDALALNASRGIDEEVTWATLGNIGVTAAAYVAAHGRLGFDGAFWLSQHVRGEIYRLGRLQFNIEQVAFDPPAGAGFRKGDPALGVHIPPGDPLTPAACDDSLARARPFFDRHVPAGPFAVATCGSWLLDPQLAGMLGDDSNIVAFQRRFTPAPGVAWPGDEDVLRFVFGNPRADVAALAPTTRLERALVAHLRAGGHIRAAVGWLALTP
jgi:GNAT-like C-terminal domain/N-acyltransferase N-terminal domain